jgi:F0F1-type ATP synthase membrane subunit a
MLGSAPYAIGYLIRSRQEQVHHPALLLAGGIMQFFFTLDTISIMILALKEKKCVKATIVLAALLALALLVLGGLVCYGIARLVING